MRTASLSASDSTKVSRLVVTARDDAFGNAALQIGQYAHLYNCEFLSLLAHPILAHPIKEDLDFGCRIELLTEHRATDRGVLRAGAWADVAVLVTRS